MAHKINFVFADDVLVEKKPTICIVPLQETTDLRVPLHLAKLEKNPRQKRCRVLNKIFNFERVYEK